MSSARSHLKVTPLNEADAPDFIFDDGETAPTLLTEALSELEAKQSKTDSGDQKNLQSTNYSFPSYNKRNQIGVHRLYDFVWRACPDDPKLLNFLSCGSITSEEVEYQSKSPIFGRTSIRVNCNALTLLAGEQQWGAIERLYERNLITAKSLSDQGVEYEKESSIPYKLWANALTYFAYYKQWGLIEKFFNDKLLTHKNLISEGLIGGITWHEESNTLNLLISNHQWDLLEKFLACKLITKESLTSVLLWDEFIIEKQWLLMNKFFHLAESNNNIEIKVAYFIDCINPSQSEFCEFLAVEIDSINSVEKLLEIVNFLGNSQLPTNVQSYLNSPLSILGHFSFLVSAQTSKSLKQLMIEKCQKKMPSLMDSSQITATSSISNNPRNT